MSTDRSDHPQGGSAARFSPFSETASDVDYDLDENPLRTAATLESYRVLSAAAYASHSHHRDVAYGDRPGERFDVFPGRPGGPLVIFFHGGWWVRGAKEERAFLAPRFLAAGATFVTAEYPLVQHGRLRDTVASACRAAIIFDWICDNISPPTAVYLAGESAGAHLALWAAARCASTMPLAGIIASSGIYDLTPLLTLRPNGWLGLDENEARELSPIFVDFLPTLPLMLAVGAREPAGFIYQFNLLASMWRGPLRTKIYENEDHFTAIARIPDFFVP